MASFIRWSIIESECNLRASYLKCFDEINMGELGVRGGGGGGIFTICSEAKG